MAALDIFNPTRHNDLSMGFNPNWNYGGPRKPPNNYATQRPRWGTWISRSIGNEGRSFACTFVDRPIEQVRYIERFYHQFKSGWFTLIDYDNGGREHAVRITSYSDDTHTANLKYTIRIVCEEVPGATMRNYPANFLTQGHWEYVVDDAMNQRVGTFSEAWVVQQTPRAVALSEPAGRIDSYELYAATPSASDFAQMEYVGWGFKMPLRMSYGLGTVNILLDEVAVVTGLNLATGAVTSATAQLITQAYTGPVSSGKYANDGLTTVVMTNVPLGRHRVKVQIITGGYGAVFPAIEVIH